MRAPLSSHYYIWLEKRSSQATNIKRFKGPSCESLITSDQSEVPRNSSQIFNTTKQIFFKDIYVDITKKINLLKTYICENKFKRYVDITKKINLLKRYIREQFF